jgi:NTP pyrophosphatase (non-canonical NTP hydrolase)
LAFLTDAGLVGRLTMSQQGRWPKSNTIPDLEHKLGECVWWLAVLADRMDMNMNEVLDKFLTKTEEMLEK